MVLRRIGLTSMLGYVKGARSHHYCLIALYTTSAKKKKKKKEEENKAIGKGIDIEEGERICILLYTDDVVLLGGNEADLQAMLNVLTAWCGGKSYDS